MLRVHGPGGQTRDFDANSAQEQVGGGLLLCRVEFRQVRDAGNLSQVRTEISNPQLVRLIAAGCWTEVENLDLDDDDREEPEPALASALAIAGGLQ